MPIHLIFDLLAACTSFAATYALYRWRLQHSLTPITPGYGAALVLGAVLGGFTLGTANLYLSGIPEIGRSILGALAGAIAAIEIYKASHGIRGSTGLIFVAAFPTTVSIGRIGCFLSGLPDNTYGTPTTLPWGHDFGDGIARHPVQLYESASMAAFLLIAALALHRRNAFFTKNGFYLMTATYAAQRFVWEFLKPYASLGPLNLFQLVCLALLAYAATMILRGRHV